ncbi:hypothetical protein SH467x_002278 [Pirellulaceae bacterium SH467]|jgi:hypothetical protein
MPPAVEVLWIQSLFLGVVFAAFGIHNKIPPILLAGMSFVAAIAMFATNATICGAISPDSNPMFPNFIRGGVKGFGGSMYVLVPALRDLSLAPIAAIVLSCIGLVTSNVNPSRPPSTDYSERRQLSIPNLLLAIAVFAIGFWQLATFIKYDAF